ncbi:hypothetical protein DMUE_6206, partial [Dictyocoela muelleri]
MPPIFIQKNINEIKNVLDNIDGGGLFYSAVHSASYESSLMLELQEISERYINLPEYIIIATNENFKIKNAIEITEKLSFNNDELGLKEYVRKRINENDISKFQVLNEISPYLKSRINE